MTLLSYRRFTGDIWVFHFFLFAYFLLTREILEYWWQFPGFSPAKIKKVINDEVRNFYSEERDWEIANIADDFVEIFTQIKEH